MFSHDIFQYFVFIMLNQSQAAVTLIGWFVLLVVVRVEGTWWSGSFEHKRKSYHLLDHST